MAILHFEESDNQLITLADIYFYDNALSFRSKGILAFLYDLKEAENLEFLLSDVSYFGRDGKDSVRSSFRELETLGYISKKMKRDDNGKFKTLEYTVHFYPCNRSGSFCDVLNLLNPSDCSDVDDVDRRHRKKSQNDRTFCQSDGKKSQNEQNYPSERTEENVRTKPAGAGLVRVLGL